MRLKFVQTATLQDKALAARRLEMRDGWLASKAKLKGGQIQNQAPKNSIGDITYNDDSIGPKASRSHMLIEHRLGISTSVQFFHSTTPFY
jgi:hypothetical protein